MKSGKTFEEMASDKWCCLLPFYCLWLLSQGLVLSIIGAIKVTRLGPSAQVLAAASPREQGRPMETPPKCLRNPSCTSGTATHACVHLTAAGSNPDCPCDGHHAPIVDSGDACHLAQAGGTGVLGRGCHAGEARVWSARRAQAQAKRLHK